jgi:hypothetical protein
VHSVAGHTSDLPTLPCNLRLLRGVILVADIRSTSALLTPADRLQHVLARLGWRRSEYRVEPGLYALGAPSPVSPVFVTANYRLSMDALRTALAGTDAYILVLNTYGINVWCAAGKGTFGTDELATRVEAANLGQIVNHRTLILPQLGAPGVSATEVVRRTGFRVEYGPVRAADLPAYLVNHTATPTMRRVRFDLSDRLTLVPVEVVHVALPLLVSAVALYLAHGRLAAIAVAMAFLGGAVFFPILLPWLPTIDFSSKGYILGGVMSLAFALAEWWGHTAEPWWMSAGWGLAYLLALSSLTAYLSLNFTGSTPFASRTGVRQEINTYIPFMAGFFGLGLLMAIALTVVRILGG